jgi:hypothetical protein
VYQETSRDLEGDGKQETDDANDKHPLIRTRCAAHYLAHGNPNDPLCTVLENQPRGVAHEFHVPSDLAF